MMKMFSILLVFASAEKDVLPMRAKARDMTGSKNVDIPAQLEGKSMV